MTDSTAKIRKTEEKSAVEVHRKSAKMLDLRAFFMIWAIEPPGMLKDPNNSDRIMCCSV